MVSFGKVSQGDVDKAMGMSKYRVKIFVDSPWGYLDTRHFEIRRSLLERGNIVGYLGRLSAEKGCLELTRAIPLILAARNDIRFLIIGDGPLRGDMEQELERSGCLSKVNFVGWLPHEGVPDYLNMMKLFSKIVVRN